MTLHRTIILMTMKWNMRSLLSLLPLKPSNSGEEETGRGNVIENTTLPESIAIAIVRTISMSYCMIHTQIFSTNSARISLLLLMDKSDVYIRFPENLESLQDQNITPFVL